MSSFPIDPKASTELLVTAPAISTESPALPLPKVAAPHRRNLDPEAAFGWPRDFLNNRFVYTVISPRAKGLSIGVNLNPDKQCNFNCIYCEVDRAIPASEPQLDVEAMAKELCQTLAMVHSSQLQSRPGYLGLPAELLQLRHVALSGDGEPTLSPKFAEACQAVVHVRALGKFPFFKIVLLTNGTGLHTPQVEESLKLFTRKDEIWIKLDAGTQSYFEKVDRPAPGVSLDQVLENILRVGRQRPVVIQSLFLAVNNQEPSEEQIENFVLRLNQLKEGGAQISLVQIYSASRPMAGDACGHLSLKRLSGIARNIRVTTGLHAEVF